MLARWSLTVLTGTAVAGAVGALTWMLSPVAPETSGVVFAVMALPFGVMLGWIIFVAPQTVPASPRAADSAEVTWLNAALAGAACDVVAVAGIGLTMVSITRSDVPAQLVLLAVLLIVFASTGVRYAIARTRAARP